MKTITKLSDRRDTIDVLNKLREENKKLKFETQALKDEIKQLKLLLNNYHLLVG
jgi:cell division protein FtsB